jgi:hypothetical protein
MSTTDPRPHDYEARQARNDESRTKAGHHTEPWLGWEEEVLALWEGGEGDLADLAEMLGRTIEACRQHYYVITRIGYTRTTIRRSWDNTTTVTVTTVTCSHCGLVHPGEC